MRRLGTRRPVHRRHPRHSRSHTRSLVPPAVLGCVAAGLLLAGCGSSPTTADQAADEPSATATASADPGVGTDDAEATLEAEEVAIVSATAAGGTVSPTALALSDDVAVQEFSRQFTGGRLSDDIAEVVARTDVPPGRGLYAAVVAVGCDVPPGVVVTSSDEGVQITAQPVTDPLPECLAPMTSVALVLVAD